MNAPLKSAKIRDGIERLTNTGEWDPDFVRHSGLQQNKTIFRPDGSKLAIFIT